MMLMMMMYHGSTVGCQGSCRGVLTPDCCGSLGDGAAVGQERDTVFPKALHPVLVQDTQSHTHTHDPRMYNTNTVLKLREQALTLTHGCPQSRGCCCCCCGGRATICAVSDCAARALTNQCLGVQLSGGHLALVAAVCVRTRARACVCVCLCV